MVMVEIDSNAILVEPLKCCKGAELIRGYNALLLRLRQAGIVPQKHVMDNEISKTMKNHIRNKCILTLELVPPGCHHRNAAEVAIRNFKSHFLSILAGVADDFPPSLWDRLLPQTETALNLPPLPIQCFAQHIGMCTSISLDLSTSTKCHWLQWGVRSRFMKRQTNKGHGHTIPSMGGINQHHLTTIACTYATSKTPVATGCQIPSILNTNISPIPLKRTPTRLCGHYHIALRYSRVQIPLPLTRTYAISKD
jgi:hypothetical protein